MNFVTLIPSLIHKHYLSSDTCNSELHPWFVTGFCDGEFSFIMSIYKKSSCTTGWQLQPIFAIDVHKKDEVLLRRIQAYFGGAGKLVKKSNSIIYSVNSIKDLVNVILPHFDNYPLLTKKRADYLLFKEAVLFMKDKKHLTLSQEIVNIRASINKGILPGSILAQEFTTSPVIKPKVETPQSLNPYWIAGFSDAEGCFFIEITKNSKIITGYAVSLLFKISQHKRDLALLNKILEYFSCGAIYNNSENVAAFHCKKLSDIQTKIFPFFNQYSLQGEKLLEYNDFCKAFSIIANKEHLTEEGLLKLKGIKLGMNTSRVKSNQNILQANVFMGLCSNISLSYLLSFLRKILLYISYILYTVKVKN